MTIKQRKLILYFLEVLETLLEKNVSSKGNSIFLSFFSRKELMAIVLSLYTNYDKSALAEKSDTALLDLIGSDSNVLSFVINQWEESIKAVPVLSEQEVHEFFDAIQIDPHYLRDKPVNQWDEYDVSNYYSILFRHGKTKRVFAIFTSDVEDKDKYAVTTKPSFFFDTKEEAEAELLNIIADKKFKKEDLKIMSLWHVNN